MKKPRTQTGVQMQMESLTNDPLLYDFELPLWSVYYPLGFPVEVTTNSHEILAAAQESWGHFRKTFSEPPVQLRIGVVEGGPQECPPIPVCRGQFNLLTRIADPGNFVVCDIRQGSAFGWLTSAAVENRAYLRYCFLEGTALTLLSLLHLTPTHSACVQLHGRGVLLCGDSGAGKSSLAFACARNGWTFLSDDGSFLVRRGMERVVTGNPHQMRFRESAIELFPELKSQRITPRITGKMAIELATDSMPEISTTSECSINYIVFLNRREPEPPGLCCFPRNKALPWFEKTICYGEKAIRDAQKASLHNLLTAEILELRYSNLDFAVNQLKTLVREGARSSGELCISSEGRKNA
jgi:hypothetical protein